MRPHRLAPQRCVRELAQTVARVDGRAEPQHLGGAGGIGDDVTHIAAAVLAGDDRQHIATGLAQLGGHLPGWRSGGPSTR